MHVHVQSQGRSYGRKLLCVCVYVCVFIFEKRQIGRESVFVLFLSRILRSEVCNLVWECANTHVHKYVLLHATLSTLTHTHAYLETYSKPVFQLILQHSVTLGIVLTGVDRCCRVVQQLAEGNSCLNAA